MSYNEKSRENLVPFRKGEDSRRMRGRRKGSRNQTNIIKQMLSEGIDSNMLFSPSTREKFGGVKDITYMKALTLALINQGLDGDTQASNILFRELRKTEEKESKTFLPDEPMQIKIVTVSSREEAERLDRIGRELQERYGECNEEISEGKLLSWNPEGP